MAQTGAAREPTMEEILASIRRIIESNDGADAASGARPQLESVAGGRIAEPAVAPTAASAAAEPPRDAPTGRAAPEPEQQMDAAPARAISLADVAARLRNNGNAARPPLDPEPAEEAEESPVASLPATEIDAEERAEVASDEIEADESEAFEPYAEPAEDFEPGRRAEPEPDRHDAVLSQKLREEPVAAPDDDPAPRNDEAAQISQRATALISTEASAKVAAAFEDLNEAVLKGKMRSFEDIAQDMLRPMLRDWLDDNLPTLVERLVREEIERVARGGRR